MIVRISGQGQFRIDDDCAGRLNQLDNDAVAAAEAGQEAEFDQLFAKMIALVREKGEALPDDELVESEVILPPADTSLVEAQAEFSGEGLLPG
jgi:hypothetical protein